jgi:hypothetical protein
MEETTLVTLIAGVITACTTIGGVLLNNFYNFKKYKMYNNLKFIELNKDLNKDTLELKVKMSDFDKKQDIEIQEIKKEITNISLLTEDIKKDVTYLKDLHKYTYLIKELEKNISKLADSILTLKDFKNKEVKEALKLGQKKAIEIFDLILNRDFDISEIKLQEEILLSLKSVKNSIDAKKLCIKEPEKFLINLESELRIITDWYIIKYNNIVKKLNGERRADFEKLNYDIIEKIYTKTIDIYKGYE